MGRTKPATKPSSVTARRQLAGRRRRVLQRQQGRPEEPARVGGAVAGQPVVVGRGQGDRGRRVLHHGEVEPDGRVQDGLVDALAVHVVQAGDRVGPAGLGLGQGAEGGGSSKVEPGRARVPSGTARISVSPTTHVLVAVAVAR